MSSSISLSTIQTNQIASLCKICSNALVLIDAITADWFRVTNIIGHLFCSVNRPTIKLINEPVKIYFLYKFYLESFPIIFFLEEFIRN